MTSRINRSLDQDSSSSSSAAEDGSQDVLSLLMGVFDDHNDETSPQVRAPYSCAHVSGSPSLHRRDVVPSHFLLKIESFASLSKSPITHYRSEFEAGGYNWEISIFPNGDKTNGGEDHISVFLRLIDTNLPIGWEVHAIFTFFLYDQIREQYVTSQDNANVLRFHAMKTKWSIIKYIDLKTFNDSSNGFLVNGSCAFGAEVFVVKNTIKGECLTMIEDPIKCTNTWKIGDFSAITQDRHASQPFFGGDYIWKIVIYPNGFGEGNGTNISLFLQLDTSSLPPNTKLFVNYVLRLKHQINGKDFEQKANNVFFSSNGWGFPTFMSLAKFKRLDNGFLLNDTCIIEAQFEVLGLIKQH
uniref:MATH domain-containing protein n=1 Tax=Cannabis sativa TaxID=3483 RepID=A0A803PE04_CANSA